MERLKSICELRGLNVPEIPNDGTQIEVLANLVLNDGRFTVPVFSSFRDLALPIASEWIVSTSITDNYEQIFSRLSVLATLIPHLQPLMEHILVMRSPTTSFLAGANDFDVLFGITRLLLHDYSRFSGYFSAEEIRTVAANSETAEVRTLAVATLGLLLEISEHELEAWILKFCGDHELALELEYQSILEMTLSRVEDSKLLKSEAPQDLITTNPSVVDFENALVTGVEGVFVPRLGGSGRAVESKDFVATGTARSNLQRAALALLEDKPLLLIGDHGSGKTSIVNHLHAKVRGGDLVRIHLGDQTDAKALVGNFTTGAQPGTFEWTPGALTSAVKTGSWVLVEDIDRAPNDIVATLLSLLTHRELVIPSRNEVIRAAPGFQIVATTTSKLSAGGHPEVIGARNWNPVLIEPPSNDDLEVLVKTKKTFLTAAAASMLLTTFRRIEEWQEWQRLPRLASTRDLVKLVNRIGQSYSADDIFRETVACFSSFLPDPWPLASVVADSMGVATSQVEPLLLRHQPAVSLTERRLIVGRAEIERRPVTGSASRNMDAEVQASKFALTQPTLRLLEEISVAVQHAEPVLLVGETGTGKTAVVQHLAKLARRKLVVINVSQQVETGDLVGGFKPVDARQLSGPLIEEFSDIFDATFSRAKNHKFLEVLERTVQKQQWWNVVKLFKEAAKMAGSRDSRPKAPSAGSGDQPKRARVERPNISSDWDRFLLQVEAFEDRLKSVEQAAQFQFIEGLLVRSIRQGSWILLDEINLAPPDTIEGINELLSNRRLTVLELGGQVVHAHPEFRIFANMNPATDVGKKDLPVAVRSQFTEVWSPSPDTDPAALRVIISGYLPAGTEAGLINDVAQLYSDSRTLAASHQLVDGAGQKPHFSIRTLSRALSTATSISKTYGLRRALFEAFCMCFMTLLDEKSSDKLMEVVDQHLLQKLPNKKSTMSQAVPAPSPGKFVQFAHWWMPCGQYELEDSVDYILTPSVERNLLNLVRASCTKMFPILIQGPTSSGKTSMVTYLAKRTGHRIVRINNHEHTDLAEYLGGYESDSNGRLVFKEGALVQALRNGHWLILDELNLAPTDVLEALNRLLDDNRELLVPETQEIIKPHPDFILFATQNPPGLYAGRKVLSRAFRNRFLELHFGDIPERELETILRDRTGVAPSYAAKIVEVYREIARNRIQRLFESAATLRDLFRWAQRPAVGYEELAFNGYALLGERARTNQERDAIKQVIERVMRVQITTDVSVLASKEIMEAAPANIVWTRAMKRVLALVEMAVSRNEPVLLVGETGCGKTTIVQAIAAAKRSKLITVNAHQNTETGDLVGSQRPVRSPQSAKLFEWVDGPLVTALRDGSMFLLDEISLADDSVLERLNSVLEPERNLFVPEIGAVGAEDGFHFLATMNPGGDYGKKELSPALRNRFTEIWCPTVDDESDLNLIVDVRLRSNEHAPDFAVTHATSTIVKFSMWFSQQFGIVSLRDILSWTEFVKAVGLTDLNLAHGACMVFIDGLGAHSHLMANPAAILKARKSCLKKLSTLVDAHEVLKVDLAQVELSPQGGLSICGFSLPALDTSRGVAAGVGGKSSTFSLAAPTSALNAMRVIRAMQVRKPVLLEGSPGAGKTSLVSALAHICGAKLIRINLSDQTDLSDLFGQDIPLDEPGKFGWRNAPFLRAMQNGEWVLLDEMNLAPQAVLEGLNACLDHRGEAYIPELDRSFAKHPGFTVFAAQNPQGQGGGRKGLPKSFVNRFSVVYVNQLSLKDLHAISANQYPQISAAVREKVVLFMEELATWSSTTVLNGGPFEFNLRDTMRWLDLLAADQGQNLEALPQKHFGLIVLQRLRSKSDRHHAEKLFYKFFEPVSLNEVNPARVTPDSVVVFNANLPRKAPKWKVHDSLAMIVPQLDALETGLRCVEKNWLYILTGASGSGKTSVVRLLAQIHGAKLREFAMTPEMDSTDLLGEFDQLEYKSELQRLWATIEDEAEEFVGIEDAALFDAVRRRDLDSVSRLIPEAKSKVHECIAKFMEEDFSKPVFRWVDGMLVRAVENGDWLVLDNANLCSAAVLDRLNSLVERNGTLSINECANSDGSPREVKPHPGFRLFMTVDPRYGELSRAMRNRGVEVWMENSAFSSYDVASMKRETVSGALPLQFSRPLTLSRIADLKSRSWIRTLVLDKEMTPLRFIPEVDKDLAEYAMSLSEGDLVGLSERHESWVRFELHRKLTNASASAQVSTLLDLSALSKIKDSVDCEFDLYGLIVAALPWVVGGGELGSVLIDLATVQDPSRIPVFRSWLLKHAQESGLVDLGQLAERSLGKEYDFSQGGFGMERIWSRFGRALGFPTESDFEETNKAIKLGMEFDEMLMDIGIECADQVADILKSLASVTVVDSQLVAAVSQFHESLSATRNQGPGAGQEGSRLLSHAFDDLWSSLSLVHSARLGVSSDTALRDALLRIAFLAERKTSDLRSVIRATTSDLFVPNVLVPGSFESTVIEILRSTSLGQARLEVQEFASAMASNSYSVKESLQPHRNVARIVTKCASQILDAVPEASENEFFQQVTEFDENNVEDTAKAAISLANQLLRLYVCPLPLDPAIAQHVWYERYVRLLSEIEDDKNCWTELKQVFSSESGEIEQWLGSRQLAQTPIPSIWRPRKSQIPIVHQDMLAAAQLAESTFAKSKTPDEIDVVLRNAEHLSSRLSRAQGYRDLISAVKAALSLLQLGLSLQKRYASFEKQSPHSRVASHLWLLDPVAVSTKSLVSSEYPLLVLRSMCFCQQIPVPELQDLLRDVYQSWTLERLRLEERQREESAGFRYNDDESEEIVAEREFRTLFPDYDELADLPDIPQQHETFAPELVELYCRLFNGPGNADDNIVGSLTETLVHSAESINYTEGLSSSSSLPALYLALQRHAQSQSDSTSTNFNFYVDSSSSELAASVRFAEKVKNSVKKLLSLWPEHDTLQTIIRVAEDVMCLPPQAAVALHLSKVEQIHHYLYEWDRFASKDVKLTEIMSDASQLVVRWRRLELATWPALFNVEKRKAREAVAPFWFHLFETLVAAPSEKLSDIAKVLIVYMSESPMGQFERRLGLLRAFERHLELIRSENVSRCVANIHNFYLQFVHNVKETMQRLESPLKKEVDDVVRLASWKDVNIHALKQSAQRSHRQLFKIVKKYRSMLETKVATEVDIAAISLDSVIPQSVIKHVMCNENWSSTLISPLMGTSEWESLPKYLQDLEKTLNMTNKYTHDINEARSSILPQADLLTFAKDVQHRALELRKETPKVWSKENKKLISALRVEKQGLLTATLRELKASGLKPSVNKSTVISQLELSHVLATSPTLESAGDNAFNKMVDILPRLRSAVSEAGANGAVDVPQSDLSRALAFAENAFAQVLKLRRTGAKHLEMPSVKRRQSLFQGITTLAHNPTEADRELSSTRTLLDGVSHLVSNVAQVATATLSATSGGLGKEAAEFTKLQVHASAYEKMSDFDVRTSESSNWINTASSIISSLENQIQANVSAGLISSVISETHSELAAAQRKIVAVQPSNHQVTSAAVSSASTPVLVIMQQVVKLISNFKLVEDADTDETVADDTRETRWLTSTISVAEKALLTLRSSDVWSKFNIAAEAIYGLSTLDAKLAGAEAARLFVFVQAFSNLTSEVEAFFEKILATTTEGTLRLCALLYSLATEGFCSPEPTQDDSEDEDAKGDGVGLGDGQGAGASSKDVDEEDDDVSEAMKTSNPEQQEKDEAEGEEDNAKSMEGDMAGEKEELPAQSDEDEDDEAEEDENEDIDDEIGDLDDLDPNAVDEKMWNDQKDDKNEKEKETDGGVQGDKDEDAEASKENDDQRQQSELGQGNEEQAMDEDTDDKGEENGESEEEDDGQSGSDMEGQDDNVNQGDHDELEPGVEQQQVLDLPEELDLDADGDEQGQDDEESDNEDHMDDDDLNNVEDGEMRDEGESNDMDDEQAEGQTEANLEEENADERASEEPQDHSDDASDDMDVDDEKQVDPSEEKEEEANSEHDDDEVNANPEGSGDGTGADIEGIDGHNEGSEEKPSADQATVTDNKTESSGKGASEDADNEQETLGEGGSSSAQQDASTENDPEKSQNDPNRSIQESLKQLGDAMKEFHRRQREIKAQENQDCAQDDGERPSTDDKSLNGTEDLEHVGAEDAFDTQALGKTNGDHERQNIDESMAIDDDVTNSDAEDQNVAGDEEQGADAGAGAGGDVALSDSENDDDDQMPTISAGNDRDIDSSSDDQEDKDTENEDNSSESQHVSSADNDLWQVYEAKIHDLALVLGEQLRLILEPTVASKLRGDYRTGKRLNMKRIIPYIASEFRKDKIWLRRTKPAKREYQILLALDDSKSMGEPAVVDLAFQAITLVGKALGSIEAGEIGVAKFGSTTEIVHSLGTPFTPQAANNVFKQFGFNQQRTNVHELLRQSLDMFSEQSMSPEDWKLEIIVSDGITDDHSGLRRLVRRAYDERVMLVFVVLDALNRDTSILDMNEVKYTNDEYGNPKLEVSKYMDDFPFDYYVMVRNITDLPMVLANVLRQYFQAVDL